MENATSDIDQPFWDVVTNRIEKHDQTIIALEKRVDAIPDDSKELLVLQSEIVALKGMISKISFPGQEVQQLNSNLRRNIDILSRPVINKVEHHHHFPKIAFATVGLFVLFMLTLMGWYNTFGDLKQFKENDTKYRFLKLQNNERLRRLLFVTDSLFTNQSDMRENVIHLEDSIYDRFKRLQEIQARENEIKNLKGKLK